VTEPEQPMILKMLDSELLWACAFISIGASAAMFIVTAIAG
jgi:hypothetical protein